MGARYRHSSAAPSVTPLTKFMYSRPKSCSRGERVVRAAPELEVVERRRSAERMGVAVVNFESEGLATSLATVVPVGASLAIAVKHRAAYGRGNVTSAMLRRWRRRARPATQRPRRSGSRSLHWHRCRGLHWHRRKL